VDSSRDIEEELEGMAIDKLDDGAVRFAALHEAQTAAETLAAMLTRASTRTIMPCDTQD